MVDPGMVDPGMALGTVRGGWHKTTGGYLAMMAFCPNVYEDGCPCHWGFHGLNRVAYLLCAVLLVSGTTLVIVHQVPASACTREVLASSESCPTLIEALTSSTKDHSMAMYWEVRKAEKHEGEMAAYESLEASCRSAGFGDNLAEFNGCVDCLDALGDCETWTRILFHIGCSLIPLSVIPLFYLCCCSRPAAPPLKVADVPITGLPTAIHFPINHADIADNFPPRAADDDADMEAVAV